MYTYSDIWQLGESKGYRPSVQEVGVIFNDVVAMIHTHGRPTQTYDGEPFYGDYRFSFDDATVSRNFSSRDDYIGFYLACSNGTLQLLPRHEPISDTRVKVISDKMPIVEGAFPYKPGSEQMYKKMERDWTFYLYPSNWGKPRIYYEEKSPYEK